MLMSSLIQEVSLFGSDKCKGELLGTILLRNPGESYYGLDDFYRMTQVPCMEQFKEHLKIRKDTLNDGDTDLSLYKTGCNYFMNLTHMGEKSEEFLKGEKEGIEIVVPWIRENLDEDVEENYESVGSYCAWVDSELFHKDWDPKGFYDSIMTPEVEDFCLTKSQ